ncbi:MAG: hypothetical protein RR550_03670, partial [Rikenellaceae bacterium]
MIEIHKSVHDNFTVEFKIGYNVDSDSTVNTFSVKTWIFMPNSLAINRQTYPGELFYRDLKVNTRLITPTFLLGEIAEQDSIPINNLRETLMLLAGSANTYNKASYEYHIKMFLAIVRSSARDTAHHINIIRDHGDIMGLANDYVRNIERITSEYRKLRSIIFIPTISNEILNIYAFGDEYMSNIIDHYTFKIITRHNDEEVRAPLIDLIKRERAYRIEKNYLILDKNSPTNNREYVFRMNVLKRFVDSDLFLEATKKQDAVIAQQVYYSIAAGISMIFATAVAFSFQQRYGSFTMPVFMALVVSYMLKDRIKDLMRYYFSNKQRTRYFDNKTAIAVGSTPLGWSRESFDFISEEKIYKEVLSVRNRSPLVEAENKYNKEEIILYRKLVQLDKGVLDDLDSYPTVGMNEIVRFNLAHLMQKMDNPKAIFKTITKENQIEEIA